MNIVVISAGRSGSNWLVKSLHSENVINLREFFNKRLDGKNKITAQDLEYLYPNPKIRESIYKYLCKSRISYVTFKSIENKIRCNNKYCLFKLLHRHYQHHKLVVDRIIDDSYLIIGLYRNNILDSYISLKKSLLTNSWWTDSNSPQPFDKNKIKINWNLADYIEFYTERVSAIKWIKSFRPTTNHLLFSYEEIHLNSYITTNENKVDYIKKKILDQTGLYINFNHDYSSFFQKENRLTNIVDHFNNPRKFLADLSRIPISYSSQL